MSATSSRRSATRRLGLALTAVAALWSGAGLLAQIPGRNINMVAGTDWPGGDPFLQRQNEPSMTASTRNPLHLVAGSNDYRTVDLPGLPDGAETGDAWVSVYKSFDGGQRWSSTLLPGYPQEPLGSAGRMSPLYGYQAAADPVVRAGTHGLIYYNGLVFDRGDNGKSAIFLTRFIDRNNKENGDPIAYLGTSLVVASNGTTFLDKPWMAVDIPRGDGAMCVVGGTPTGAKVKRNGHRRRGKGKGKDRDDDDAPWLDPGLQYVPAGAVYVAYTAITGEGSTLQSQIFVKRSMDCGVTWTAPMRVTATTDMINQGATLAISPATGDLFVAWRRFSTPTLSDVDAVMMARLRINGGSFDAPGKARGLRRTGPDSEAVEKIFEHRKRRATPVVAASVSQIDQPTSPYRFRSNAYPSMTVDGNGRAYVAWSERGYAAARPDPTDGDARILVASTLDGRTFSAPVVVDDQAQLGHQLMPSLAFAGGKLMLLFYDLRETRAQTFSRFVDDSQSTNNKRQTIDIRAAMGTPGATPAFAPSVRVSDYLMGYRNSTATLEQLQVNPPNLPMFKQGTVPFIGDYIDIAPAPAFVPTATGDWVYNTAPSTQMPVFHATWTDNRDVRAPLDGNWANYTPPTINGQLPAQSLFDPTQTVAMCKAGNAGSRNQNIYTARIGGGLLVGAPGNTKPLSPTVQRGFVVFAQNQTTATKTFRMAVLAQPVGGRASFEQFPLPPYTPASPAPLTVVDVKVPARSTATRTVYVTSTDPKASLSVDVAEVAAVAGPVVNGGLAGRVVLNPDIENPDIENPDIENPDIVNPDIENAEVYNPDIENPDIENPDIENPDIENPDIENPDIENVNVANPDIENLGIANPDIENPDIENPDIENPGVANPDIENGAIADVTWSVSNIGNTTSGFNVNLFLANANVPAGLKTQLIVYKVYKTPVLAPNGCDLRTETRNQVLFNVPNPNLITPGEGLPSQNDPSDTNATLWLAPGEVGRVTLRVFDDDTSNNLIYTNLDGTTASIDPAFNPATVVTAAISAQGVDVLDPPGATKPPAVTTTGTNLFFLQQPTNVAPATLIAPAVRARIWDNTGAPLPGVVVSIALLNPPPGVLLSGTTTAVADASGIATFPALSVNVPATGLQLRATATSAGVVAAGTSAPFDVALAGWTATGSGLVTLVDNGAGGTPRFTYDNPGVFTGAWTLSKVATATETLNLTYAWNGFHSYFNVATGLDVFVNRGGTDVYVGPLVNEPLTGEGPVVCCAFPSGGFSYAGATTVSVQPGDTYGFRVRGSHGDGTLAMNGTLSVVVGGNPYFTVAVRGTAGGFEDQTPGFGPSSVPARVYGGTLAAGQQFTVVGSGQVQRGLAFAPTGAGGSGVCDVTCLLPGAPIGSLLARVGTGPWQLVGFGPTTLTAASAGLLEFAVNDNFFNDNSGAYQATVVWGVPAPAVVSLSNWAQIYDGTPKAVTVTTVPAGLATSVVYNGSTTAPSAIGAYFVDAVAFGPGHLGRASLNQTIASTLSAGGFGGGPYPAVGALSCAPGVFATGIRASNTGAYGLVGGQLICATGANPAPVAAAFESATPTYTDVTCGPGEVMVGVHGQTGAPSGFRVVERIGPQCQSTSGFTVTNAGPAGGVGGGFYPDQSFSLTCNPGEAVTGILGGAGEVVDSLALVCAPVPVVTSPTITSVSPSSGAPGEGFLVVRGTGFPPVLPSFSATAVVTNGATTSNGFIFQSPSTTSAYWVRLPSGFPTGAATIQIVNGASATNAFPITVSAAPGTPVITGLFDSVAAPLSFFSGHTSVLVRADGIDTTGAVVRFQQGVTSWDVPAGAATSNSSLGLAVEVPIPGIGSGFVACQGGLVSIRQGGSAFSATWLVANNC